MVRRWFRPTVLILLGILGLRGVLLYWGLIVDRFIVPPGGDIANHLSLINHILTTGNYQTGYPPAFHAIVAYLARGFSWDPLTIVVQSGPLIILLGTLSTYLAAKKLFGEPAGLWAAALIGLNGIGPILGYGDGNYPNLIATNFFLPLCLVYLVAALRGQVYRHMTVSMVCLLGVMVFHHLGFFVAGTVISLFLGILWLTRLISRREPIPHLIPVTVVAVIIIAIGLIAGIVIYGQSLLGPALSSILRDGQPIFSNAYLATPPQFSQYLETIGPVVWTVGVLGLIIVIVSERIALEIRLLILVWVGSLLVMSRLSLLGLPFRFARELTIPLAILGGYLIAQLVFLSQSFTRRLISQGLVAIFLAMNIVMLTAPPFQLPEGLARMVWFWPDDQQKLAALQKLPPGSIIAAPPSSPYYELFLKDRKFIGSANPELVGAQYIFIGTKPPSNPDPVVYPFFAGYEATRQALENYPKAVTIIKFPDGSQIKKVLR